MNEEGCDGEGTCSEKPSLLSYTLRYVWFTEVGNVCRVALREPMHMCTCVSEEGDDGETERNTISAEAEGSTRLTHLLFMLFIMNQIPMGYRNALNAVS